VCGCGGECGKRSTLNAQRSTLKDSWERSPPAARFQLPKAEWTPERLEKWCYWMDRIADAMGIISVSTMGTVFAVILWEWVKLYRSLPPGSMRFMQF
jgi:hypothetical protein